MRTALLLATLVLGGCVGSTIPKSTSDAASRCASAYLNATAQGQRLVSDASCRWEEIIDQGLADQIQGQVRKTLETDSPVAGYKVTFAEDGRVVGVLTENMLLSSPASISLTSGSQLLVEADLLVRIKSLAVNQATTPEDVAAHIDAVIPFLESSNLVLPKGTPRKRAIWTAVNGNARWGTMGKPVLVEGQTAYEIASMLGRLTAELIGPDGNVLQRSGMSRHPLESVIDAASELARLGAGQLKPGDLISLGNFGRPRFPKSGQTFAARYIGFEGLDDVIEVTFE